MDAAARSFVVPLLHAVAHRKLLRDGDPGIHQLRVQRGGLRVVSPDDDSESRLRDAHKIELRMLAALTPADADTLARTLQSCAAQLDQRSSRVAAS